MKLQIGEMVVVAHWSDFDMQDAVMLGILQEITPQNRFIIAGHARHWRYCRKVSREVFKHNDAQK